MIATQKAAGRGCREVMRLPSTTTSGSRSLAAGVDQVVLDGEKGGGSPAPDTPAEASIQPAWQMAATTFPASCASPGPDQPRTMSGLRRMWSGA